MIFEGVLHKLSLKFVLSVVFLFAEVVHPVVALVPLLKELLHLSERVPIKSFEVFTGEAHSQYVISYIGEVQIIPIPLEPPLVLRDQSLDGVLDRRDISNIHVLGQDLNNGKDTAELTFSDLSPGDLAFPYGDLAAPAERSDEL